MLALLIGHNRRLDTVAELLHRQALFAEPAVEAFRRPVVRQ